MTRLQPIGVTPNQVTTIPSQSTELPRGQVRYERARRPRVRIYRVTRSK